MSDNPFDVPPENPAPPPTPTAAPAATPPPGPIINGTTADDRTMAMLAHLLGIFTGFLGPLIIWLVKKDQSEFVNDQGREVVNFHITVGLVSVVVLPGLLILSVIPLIGCLIFPIFILTAMAISIGSLVFHIMGTVKANEGIAYRYPFNFRLIK
jgi:uncharacterized Tic20 family protein